MNSQSSSFMRLEQKLHQIPLHRTTNASCFRALSLLNGKSCLISRILHTIQYPLRLSIQTRNNNGMQDDRSLQAVGVRQEPVREPHNARMRNVCFHCNGAVICGRRVMAGAVGDKEIQTKLTSLKHTIRLVFKLKLRE